jgi:UDP-N-acetyl-D-mannosaminuronate dehydrogenase
VLVTSTSTKQGLYVTSVLDEMKDCNYYIITVPTPVDKNNRPDLTPLYKAKGIRSKVLKRRYRNIRIDRFLCNRGSVPVLERGQTEI